MAVDVVAEEVANNLNELADVTRHVNTKIVGYFSGGVALGFALGFYWGYKFNKEKIRAEAFRQSEEEVKKIREMYQQKVVAATPKPSVEEVVEERGYSTRVTEEPSRPIRPPVPVTPPPVVIYEGGKDADAHWDWREELQNRSPEAPYVIHQTEFTGKERPEYNQVTYTYYALDDVLVDDENDHPLPHGDLVVGVENLKFGHGTDDIDVVFVRNDKLGLEMEICRVAKSYEEDVLGLERHDDDENQKD